MQNVIKLFLLTGILSYFSSCTDWGQMDDPAGNQVFPKLELRGEYRFEEELSPDEITLFAYDGGKNPQIVTDEFKGKVLALNGGYARLNNPLYNVKVQTGVSVTMWMKTTPENPDGAIFSFADEDGSERIIVTPSGLYCNSPDVSGQAANFEHATDSLASGEWHYVALSITNEGYTLYISGEKITEDLVPAGDATGAFDYPALVQVFTRLPYLYLGYGSGEQPRETRLDDIRIYRNVITAKEIAVPVVTVGEEYQFPPRGTVGYYLLDNSFVNSLNPAQSGELVTVETQATPSAFEQDIERGIVWHQQEGWTDHANGWAYTRLDNPLRGKTLEDGISISMWLNPPVLNWWDQIFVLNDGTSKFWFNAIGYLGYNGAGGWFDCHNNNAENALTPGVWTFVTINISTDGFAVYYDGILKFDNDNNAGFNSGDFSGYSAVLDMFTSSSNFYLGYETWWKAAPTLIDDLFLGTRPLTEKEIQNLYQDTKKANGGIPVNPAYAPGLTGYYPLNSNFTNAVNTAQGGEFVTVEVQATPSKFEEDPVRGTVWHQQEGWTDHANGWAYTRFDNPLKGKSVPEGLSVSMWLNPPVLNWWDQIFVLNDGTSKFWFNAIGYLGYNGSGGWFDCHNNNAENALEVGVWTLVTINILPDKFEVYYNGALKFDTENNAAFASGDFSSYSVVLDMFTSANNFYFGYETWWKAAPALIDDVYMCTSPLTADQAAALYNATKK
jgi:hypothetical protein